MIKAGTSSVQLIMTTSLKPTVWRICALLSTDWFICIRILDKIELICFLFTTPNGFELSSLNLVANPHCQLIFIIKDMNRNRRVVHKLVTFFDIISICPMTMYISLFIPCCFFLKLGVFLHSRQLVSILRWHFYDLCKDFFYIAGFAITRDFWSWF